MYIDPYSIFPRIYHPLIKCMCFVFFEHCVIISPMLYRVYNIITERYYLGILEGVFYLFKIKVSGC